MKARDYIHGMRLRTLPLGIAPVAAAAALSYNNRTDMAQPFSVARFWILVVACLCVAVFLQVAANFANDYSDGVRGTDWLRAGDARSEGPRRLVAGGIAPKQVLMAAAANATLACIAGLVAVILTGYWWLIAVGLVCLAAAWWYVGGKHPYGYAGFGEISVFVFFGLVPVLGTAYVLTGALRFTDVYAGVILGFIAVGVLCMNNLRDEVSDEQAGKRTWMVMLGGSMGRVVTGILLGAAILLIVLPWCNVVFPTFTQSFGSLGWFMAGLLAMIACLDMLVRALNALYQRTYNVAMRTCSISALLFALMLIFAAF